MIKYRVYFQLMHILDTKIPVRDLIELHNQGKHEEGKEKGMVIFFEYKELFESDKPIEARRSAFAYVNQIIEELLKAGYTDSRKIPEGHQGPIMVFFFTIWCVFDGQAMAVARPVNTSVIQQYKAAEYALYQTYGFDIGSEEPATEFIPELVRTIEVIPE